MRSVVCIMFVNCMVSVWLCIVCCLVGVWEICVEWVRDQCIVAAYVGCLCRDMRPKCQLLSVGVGV